MQVINLQPARLDIYLCQGTDWNGLVFTARDRASGNPIDLTGAAVHMQIRDAQNNVLDDLSSANGRLVLGGASGTIAPVGPTDAYTFASAVYDCKLIDAGGVKRVLFAGNVYVRKGVTQ